MPNQRYNLDEIFDYIKEFVTRYPGAFPTRREMSDRFGMSTSVSSYKLDALIKAGKLARYETKHGKHLYIPDMLCVYRGATVEAERMPEVEALVATLNNMAA